MYEKPLDRGVFCLTECVLVNPVGLNMFANLTSPFSSPGEDKSLNAIALDYPECHAVNKLAEAGINDPSAVPEMFKYLLENWYKTCTLLFVPVRWVPLRAFGDSGTLTGLQKGASLSLRSCEVRPVVIRDCGVIISSKYRQKSFDRTLILTSLRCISFHPENPHGGSHA